MSNSEKKVKKVIVSSKKKGIKATVSRKNKVKVDKSAALIYGQVNFKWMLIGLAVIALGMFLMSGGAMESPDVWDDSRIYSFRRITLAPFVILVGLGIEVYAIFK